MKWTSERKKTHHDYNKTKRTTKINRKDMNNDDTYTTMIFKPKYRGTRRMNNIYGLIINEYGVQKYHPYNFFFFCTRIGYDNVNDLCHKNWQQP